MRSVGRNLVAILLFTLSLSAQTSTLESFAPKLVASASEAEQGRMLEENKALVNADLIAWLQKRGKELYEARDIPGALKIDNTRLLVATTIGDKPMMADANLVVAQS